MTNREFLLIVSMIRKSNGNENGIAHANSESDQMERGIAASRSQTSFRIRVKGRQEASCINCIEGRQEASAMHQEH